MISSCRITTRIRTLRRKCRCNARPPRKGSLKTGNPVFRLPLAHLERNGFNGATKQCVQSRVGTRCPRVTPPKGSLKTRGQQVPTLRNYGTVFRLPLAHWNTTVLTGRHSNAYKVGGALVAHTLPLQGQPEIAWAAIAHPTKLRNNFQAALGTLEHNGFNETAQQCNQGRVGTRCPRVAPQRQPEIAWAASAHPTKL